MPCYSISKLFCALNRSSGPLTVKCFPPSNRIRKPPPTVAFWQILILNSCICLMMRMLREREMYSLFLCSLLLSPFSLLTAAVPATRPSQAAVLPPLASALPTLAFLQPLKYVRPLDGPCSFWKLMTSLARRLPLFPHCLFASSSLTHPSSSTLSPSPTRPSTAVRWGARSSTAR